MTGAGWLRSAASRLRSDARRAGLEQTVRPVTPTARHVDVRIARELFDTVVDHVESFCEGEEAGFLLCSLSRTLDRDVLLAREWIPVPETELSRNTDGSVLAWSAAFNSSVLQRAIDLGASPVLVHSHGTRRPAFSDDDRAKEAPLFGAFSRLLDAIPTGTLLLGQGDAAGSFWNHGRNELRFGRLVIVGETIDVWSSAQTQTGRPERSPRGRLVRQSGAIGPGSDAALASTRVAVLGVSGGGSHVIQQLAHQGVGTLLPVDDQLVEESNLGRLVGASEHDVDVSHKTQVARRVATGIDASITVVEVRARFPSSEAIATLKAADIIVGCVDTFQAREAINAFCRRYLIPLVDVGLTLRSRRELLVLADGQVIVSLPGRPCMRCWFLSDAVLDKERREHPPGYDRNPDAPGEPQVVSMNGVLASEASNCVLDLITGYSGGRRGAKVWQYEGRSGQLEQAELPPCREDCPACAEEGCGDPS
jgi:molybdopterin/thiamine biosynthesis adenylyltransferase